MGQREVLIVDDDRQVRDVLHQIFLGAGYKCLLANDGQEGVEVFRGAIREGRSPLTVTDLKMPIMGGIDLLQQVRQADPDAAVIVLTGAADVKTAISSLKLGAYDFIMKPVNVDELLIAADRALERRQLLLEHRHYQELLERRVEEATRGLAQLNRELQDAYRTTLEALGSALDTRDVRARYRLNGEQWVLTVARLEPYKGVDIALRALAQTRKDGHEVSYLVVGVGKKRNTYKRLAEELGVGDAVRFVGAVPDRDLPALYNVAQAYLGVSRKGEGTRVEGFGIALAEASACGLPVVAGRSGGLAEAVQDGETGFVVDPEDPAAVSAALSRLLTDQLLARRLGQAGRKAVETHYNWDRVVSDLREIESQVSS